MFEMLIVLPWVVALGFAGFGIHELVKGWRSAATTGVLLSSGEETSAELVGWRERDSTRENSSGRTETVTYRHALYLFTTRTGQSITYESTTGKNADAAPPAAPANVGEWLIYIVPGCIGLLVPATTPSRQPHLQVLPESPPPILTSVNIAMGPYGGHICRQTSAALL